MPPLHILALRYVAWLIGLSIVYGVFVQLTGLPNPPASGVILAAAPMADLGMQAVRRATRTLSLRDWATIWGVGVAIFVALRLILPAILFQQVRDGLGDPAGLRLSAIVIASTALMMVVFLWIGARSSRVRTG